MFDMMADDAILREKTQVDHVSCDMINLLKDEVLYLRGELAKTRDLLGEIIKTKFEKDERYEKKPKPN